MKLKLHSISAVTHPVLSDAVIIIDEPCRASTNIDQVMNRADRRNFLTSIYSHINNDSILATLTEALGSHVISVLREYPERAAEYLRNWHTECRIYHDRCVVTRRGEVIAEGVF